MPESQFLRYIRHLLPDFENNGTVDISDFFSASDGLQKTNFWNQTILGVWWSPLWFRYLWGSVTQKRLIYDISGIIHDILCRL